MDTGERPVMTTAPLKSERMPPSSAFSLGLDRKARRAGHEQIDRPSLRIRLPQAIKRLLSLRGAPREIALGFAAGIFVGMSPFMMCHSAMAICLATLLKGNRLSAVAGVFITNPISAPLVYGWTYRVGKAWLGIESARTLNVAFSLDGLFDLVRCAPEIAWILTVGGFVAGLPLAALSYFLCYHAIRLLAAREIHPPATSIRFKPWE